MATTELATAYISLAVSGKGLRKDIDKAMGASSADATRQGRGLGSKVAKGFGFAAKAGFAGAGVVAGAALAKGFGRLKGLDDARGKLEGLGHSTKAVDGIMKNALGSVKGTAFGLDEAATTAAGSVAAGIKPGKELQGVLSLVADSATIAGTDMGSMGAIFNKVAASNKIQGDVIAQLGDQGIPILQFLSKEMGVSAEEVSKLASAGKVDFKTFQSAMEAGLGGAAQKSGKTFSGAFKNMGAAAGRLGASLLSGVFPKMKGGFGGITDLLDKMGPTAEAWGKKVGDAVATVAGYVGDFVADFKAGDGAAGRLRDAMEGLFSFIKDSAIPAAKDLGEWVMRNKEMLLALGGAVLAGVVAFKAFMFIKTVIAAVKAARLAVLAFNASLLANPIFLVVALIGALVGALIYLYRNNDKARAIMQAAWAKIKEAIAFVVDWVKTVAWPILKTVFTAIGNVVKWLWSSVIKPYIGFMWAYWKTVFGFLKTWVWPVVKDTFSKIAAIAKWLWNNAIKPAFSAIWGIAKSVFGWIKNTGWPLVRGALGLIGNAAKGLWNNWIKPYFEFVLGKAKSVFGWIKNTGWPLIRSAFQSIGDKAKWLWDKGVKGPFNRIKSGIGAVKDAIVTARDGIKSAWSKLTGYLQDPITKALNWLNTNFIDKLNGMLKGINVSFRIPRIGMGGGQPKRGQRSGNQQFATGGYTGPGSKYQPAGVVHADEYVLRKESVNKLRKTVGLGGLDHMNRTGTLPGYAIGGKVQGLNKRFLEQLSAFNEAAGGRYSVNSGYRSNAHQQVLYNRYLSGNGPIAARPGSSMHNRGLAADLAPGNARDVHGPLAALFGLSWTVPSESWHIEPNWGRGSNAGPSKGGGGGGGGFSLPGWVSDAFGWVKGKFESLTKGFDAGRFGLGGQVIESLFGKIRSAVTDAVKGAASEFSFGFSSGGLVPPVFDNGGTLAPGLNLVNNKLGKPEPLVRADMAEGIDYDALASAFAEQLRGVSPEMVFTMAERGKRGVRL